MVFLGIVFEIFRGFTKTSCSDEIYFISYVCRSCFIVGEDDSGRRGSVRGRQCHHHALRYTIMTMNTNACRNVHNFVTYIKCINRAIMICLCAQRLVNTDHKTHNKIASNSIDFGLKMHYFQNFPGRCPRPRWGAHSAPQAPSWIFHPQTPLNPDPSTLLRYWSWRSLLEAERQRPW